MPDAKPGSGPVLRLFEVRTKPGCAEDLMRNFATTSADVVRDNPGNEGYFFGRGAGSDDDVVFFASVWTDLNAVRERFGTDWQESFLPPGYEDLIDEHSVRHFDLSGGWHVNVGD